MRTYKFAAMATALSFGIVASPVSAAELILDGSYSTFAFFGAEGRWNTGFFFTLSNVAELQITDLFNTGDQFEIFINSERQGLTSDPTGESGFIGNDFDAAFSDPRWSSASYILGPGEYTVTGRAVAVDPLFPAGSGGIRLRSVNSAVPEPASWAFMILGLGFIGGTIRTGRRRQRVNYSFA